MYFKLQGPRWMNGKCPKSYVEQQLQTALRTEKDIWKKRDARCEYNKCRQYFLIATQVFPA